MNDKEICEHGLFLRFVRTKIRAPECWSELKQEVLIALADYIKEAPSHQSKTIRKQRTRIKEYLDYIDKEKFEEAFKKCFIVSNARDYKQKAGKKTKGKYIRKMRPSSSAWKR
jgi:hypothetical protein